MVDLKQIVDGDLQFEIAQKVEAMMTRAGSIINEMENRKGPGRRTGLSKLDDQLKIICVGLVIGRPVSQIARELGVSAQCLHRYIESRNLVVEN